MGTVVSANIPQTLYVTLRRDELADLRLERDSLAAEVVHLTAVLQQVQRQVLGNQVQARIA